MTTIQINEKTKIGKNVLEMLKALAEIENNNSIKILGYSGNTDPLVR